MAFPSRIGFVVHNGIDLSICPAAGPAPAPERDKVVLFLGRITMQKRPEYFLYAAKRGLEPVKKLHHRSDLGLGRLDELAQDDIREIISGASCRISIAACFRRSAMEIKDFLRKSGVPFEVHKHTPVFTAQRMAAVEHERGRYVAKPVIVKADGRYLMCVLPASQRLDLAKLKTYLAARSVELAKENEIADLFPGCQVGAEPPFGHLYGVPTLMDKALERDDHILFQAGTHEEAVRMSMADYRRLAEPKVLDYTDRPSLRRRLAVLLSRLTDYFAK